MLRKHCVDHPSGEGTLPAHAAAPVDLAHLARMTLGDRRLQQEILALFDQQIEVLIARLGDRNAASLRLVAHTLKGSARSIGAWDLVHAAEAVEAALACGGPLEPAIGVVGTTGARVRSAISQMRQNEADPDGIL